MPCLSLDLRERIVSAYERGEGSYRRLGERFNVTKNTVMNLVRLKEQTGALKPQYRATRAPTLSDEDCALVKHALESELTQEQTARYVHDQTGKEVSQRTISRTVRRMDWTRKKKR